MKKTLKYVLICIAVIALLTAAAYAALQTKSVQQWLAGTLEEQLSDDAQKVAIQNLSGNLPWEIHIQQVTVADAKGAWLEVDDAHMTWQPFALLWNEVNITTLKAAKVDMKRQPLAVAKEDIKEETFDIRNFSLPEITIGKVSVPKLHLPAEYTAGEPTTWHVSMQGSTAGDGFNGQIHTTQGPKTTIDFTALIKEQLAITANISEAPGGLIATLSGLNTSVPLTANIDVKGTPDRFLATANMQHGETELFNVTANKAESITIKGQGSLPPALVASLSLPENSWQIYAVATQQGEVWQTSNSYMTFGNAKLQVEGAFDVDSQKIEPGIATLTIPNLAPWSAAAGSTLSGDLNAKLDINGKLDDLTMHLGAKTLQSGQPLLLDTNIGLEDEQITLSELRLEASNIKASGGASYDLSSSELSANLNAAGLSLASLTDKQLSGNANGALELSGTLDDLQISLSGTADKLAGLPEPLDVWLGSKAALKAEANYSAEALVIEKATLDAGSIKATAKGTMPLGQQEKPSAIELALKHAQYGDANISADVLLNKDMLRLNNVRGELPNTTIAGTLDINMNNSLASGALKLDSSNIAPFANWAAMPAASGRLNGNISLSHKGGMQAAKVDLVGGDIKVPSENIRVSKVDIEVQTSDINTLATLKLDAILKDAMMDDMRINSARANISSPAARKQASVFTVAINGSQQGQPLALVSEGVADLMGETRNIIIRNLVGNYQGKPYELAAPAVVDIAKNELVLAPISLRYGKAVFALSGKKSAGAVDAKITLAPTPLDDLLDDASYAIDGTAELALSVSGKASAPLVKLTGEVNIDPATSKDKPVRMSLESVWDNTQSSPSIASNAQVIGNEKLGEISLMVPASLSLAPYALSLHPSTPMSGTADLSTPLAQFNSWIAPLGHELAGLMQAKLDIGGTLGEPQLGGMLNWQGGSYDHLAYGICLRDIDMQASFNNDQLILQSLEATGDKKSGKLTGSGQVALTKNSINSELRMQDLAVFCHGLAKGEINGNISLSGMLDEMNATGKLALGPMTVGLPTGGEDEIPRVQTIYKRDLAFREKQKAKDGIVNLGIDVELAEPIFVRGRGLDTEFEGAVRIEGTASRPELDGKITTKRGTVEVIGSTLNISSGSITFLERDPVKPYMNVKATTKASGVDINVLLKGLVTEPKLSFTSNPSKPQDEVLALLLFGSPLQEISPFQALQLAQAAAALAGKSSGPSVLGLARETLGVDTLSISQDEEGGTTVGAGKYVTDRVFVGVEQGTTPESRKVKTEIELTPNIAAETAVGAQGGPSLGVEWRYDY